MKTYTATVTSTGGRHGRVHSSDGALKVELMPPSTTVQNPTRTNPEQLFAAGYSACFSSAVEHVAKQQKLVHGLITVVAKAHLFGPSDEGDFHLGADLDVTIAEVTQAEAEALVAEADKVCPYSKAVRGNVEVTLTAHGTV